MTVPRVYGHAAGWWVGSHLAQPIKTAAGYASGCEKTGGPRCPIINVEGGASSDWVDVGKQMDVLQVVTTEHFSACRVSASVLAASQRLSLCCHHCTLRCLMPRIRLQTSWRDARLIERL